MSKINFEKVITREDLLNFNEEKYEFLIKEADFHSNYIKVHFSGRDSHTYIPSRARELAFISGKYSNEDNTFKELLAARIVYNNDKKIIDFLLDKGIGYSTLSAYSTLISKTKELHSRLEEFGLKDNDDITISNKKLNNLCRFFQKYYGFSDFNLILAKVNELVIFKRELYLQMEEKCNEKTKVLK